MPYSAIWDLRSFLVRQRNLLGAAAVCLLCWSPHASAQAPATDGASASPTVLALTNTFNDENIPFNDKLVMLGKADAPLTSVFIFGLSADTTDFVKRFLPGIMSKYVATGKMKIVVIDFPLSLHDMQALAGFRCVAADKHWELLQSAVRYYPAAHNLKIDSVMNAPGHIWRMMKDFGVSRESAEKCMRNNAVVGHVEAQRRVVTETWNTSVAPTFVVGRKVLINPNSAGSIDEAIEAALKGSK